MSQHTPCAARCAVLVGPYLSGKTTLLESLLHATGTLHRKGTVKDGSTLGDHTSEARARHMSTEMNLAHAQYLDEDWTFIDCPGSVELLQDGVDAMQVADCVIVVCEPDETKAPMLAPLLHQLDESNTPHIVFINKMDQPGASVKATLEALQIYSDRPLVLREIPIRDGENVSGHVDLVSERAFKWRDDGKPSQMCEIPEGLRAREQQERAQMLETLADFDDGLLEELLEDVQPSSDEIYDNLSRDLKMDKVVPVFFGSAEGEHGVNRLLKALRHETPAPSETATRIGQGEDKGAFVAQVFKTLHAGHAGKLSVARVWSGTLEDGMSIGDVRVNGLLRIHGAKHDKIAKAQIGDVVAVPRLDNARTGDLLSPAGIETDANWLPTLSPLYAMAVHANKRADEVKLSEVLAKLVEEDVSLRYGAESITNEMLLWGQGDIHLAITQDRLKGRFNLEVTLQNPSVAYKETIRKGKSHHARHKKQSGGHGEFGDVHLDIQPLARGEGFSFNETVSGGAVPRQYFQAVEAGVRDSLVKGPLGFPVVDISVTLTDGQHHAVDSSEMAFRKAGQLAMREALPDCQPVLLEPIFKVEIAVPSVFSSKIQRLVSARRAQILGFEPKSGWAGWDQVGALMPAAEMHDLIVELRSQTLGVGTYHGAFDHLQELTGRLADDVVAQRSGK